MLIAANRKGLGGVMEVEGGGEGAGHMERERAPISRFGIWFKEEKWSQNLNFNFRFNRRGLKFGGNGVIGAGGLGLGLGWSAARTRARVGWRLGLGLGFRPVVMLRRWEVLRPAVGGMVGLMLAARREEGKVELTSLATEASQSDGRLARRPLENMSNEIQAHCILLSKFKHMIKCRDAAVKILEEFLAVLRRLIGNT
ncbi:hypothetical protein IEQ34_026920 [Dendrobium chrysotoxum]|uniref:Uncharacterized protein n=1 Tax=Dendrobium chrysotoxum TaxID=161865 RepID=A0AAV7FL17_DENCH|nr:hypothetical protein IEQ34_026920 [Dendrobium chrysotoxum]